MKKILLLIASAAMIVCGCSKIDELSERVDKAESSISALQKDLESIKSELNSLKSQVSSGAVITSVKESATGYDITLSNGNVVSVRNGADGDSFFSNVTIGSDSVTFDFVDGTSITVPFFLLLNQLTDIKFIPEYSDGCATVNYFTKSAPTIEMSFFVEPFSVAAEFAEKINDYTFMLVGSKLQTRSPELYNVSASASIKGQILTVTGDASTLLDGFNVAVMISRMTLEEERITDFVPLFTDLVYAGETYGVKMLKDGRIWMTDNLRYLPEGVEAKGDFTDNTGIWLPAKFEWDPASTVLPTPVPSKDVVATQGYLYTEEAALKGVALPTHDFEDLDYNQGVCPDGWHIPTAQEWINLLGGCSNKDHSNTSAPYYDESLSGASLEALNADGFNFLPYPYVNQGKSYMGSLLNKTDASRTYYGMSNMLYFASSTGRSEKQSYAAMITNNATKTYANVAYNTLTNGIAVRCIKNAE